MQPYVIRDNDYLAKVAYTFGFDPDAVWNDPSNDDLRKLRPNPNVLLPGDVLYIPDPTDDGPSSHSLTTGSTNTFVAADAPTVTVTQTFSTPDATRYGSRAFTVAELEELTGLSTDENGTATFFVPVSLDQVTIVFSDDGESWRLVLGGMDPIDTLVGVFKRLQNLRYMGPDVVYEPSDELSNLPAIRYGLTMLRAARGVTSAPSDSGRGLRCARGRRRSAGQRSCARQ